MPHDDHLDFSAFESEDHDAPRQLLRMKIDPAAKYSAGRPPCQLLPWLIGTNGIDLYVESDKQTYCRVMTKDIKFMIQDGYYVWAKQRDALKDVGRAIRNPFLIGVTKHFTSYRPLFQSLIKMPASTTLMHVEWKRQPCTRFVAKPEDF